MSCSNLSFFGREQNQKLLLYTERSTSYPHFFSGLFLCLLQFELPAEVKCCALCSGCHVPFFIARLLYPAAVGSSGCISLMAFCIW